MREDSEDQRWCPWCEKETTQIVHDDGHERDSSYDYYECKECGARASGMSGFDNYLLPGKGFKRSNR